jgi:hypothetical protein
MLVFRVFLLAIFATIVAYTALVISNHALNHFPVFFGDIATTKWPGQFNLDFLGFLFLSGFWLAWRNGFSTRGIVLGVLGVFLGAPTFASSCLALSEPRSPRLCVAQQLVPIDPCYRPGGGRRAPALAVDAVGRS